MERTPQGSLAFARRFAAARARAAESILFLETVAVGNGGATTGNECVDVDVNTTDEAEAEAQGEQLEAFGRPASSMITQVTITLHEEHMNTNLQEEFL